MAREKEELLELLTSVQEAYEKEANESLSALDDFAHALNGLRAERISTFVRNRLGHLPLCDLILFSRLFLKEFPSVRKSSTKKES
jgi:hypothetical protein